MKPKKLKAKDAEQLEQHAAQIANEIFALMGQYTHDSATSKFFLNDEISKSIYITAGSFSSVVYMPQLELEEIPSSTLLPLFMILITYGFQIYLKERSLKTNASPFRLPTDEQAINSISEAVLSEAIEGNIVITPLAETIVGIILEQLQSAIDLEEYKFDEYEIEEKKFYEYMTISLLYGYNLASVLLQRPKSS